MNPCRSANSTLSSRCPDTVSSRYRSANRSSYHWIRTPATTSTNATSSSTCHSHHDSAQFRANTSAIIASPSSTNAAIIDNSISDGRPTTVRR